MNDLKPCPFCGGEATLVGFSGNWYVRCDSCLATSDDRALRQTVIDAWNTRAERTCYVVNEMYDDVFGVEIQLSCGHNVPMFRENFNYCPSCGAKVVG